MEGNDLTADAVHTLAAGTIRRIFGPPGTGKTTTLAAAVKSTALERGGASMLITSFTTTAANAIGRAALRAAEGNPAARVPDSQIGTLHSFGYRAIGHPDVALDPKVAVDWNDSAPVDWRITPDSRRATPDVAIETGMLSGDSEIDGARTGDELLAALDVRRATLVPEGEWPPRLRAFAERWTAWKRANGVVDFSDMIHEALERALEGERAPGDPRVLIVDEAQDLTPVEAALVLAWGRHTDTTVFALDDDQAINEWRGGDARPILAIGTDAAGEPRTDLALTDRVLGRSHRIPSSVHAAAERWIRRISGPRAEKVYRPREERGSIQLSPLTIGDPRLVDRLADDIEAGHHVMVIASCGYMLQPLLSSLRRLGIPFGNPYRPAESKWNPLRPATRGVTAAQRLYSYLVPDERLLGAQSRLWTGDDIRLWSAMVLKRAARFTRDASKIIETLPTGEAPWELVSQLFADDDALTAATEPNLDWLVGCASRAYADKLIYPAAVVRRSGPAALMEPPRLTVGTIHSAKGGEADLVYVDPSISVAASAQWAKVGSARDQLIRLMYVAMTRAARRCVLLHPTGRHGVPRRMLLPEELEVADAAA